MIDYLRRTRGFEFGAYKRGSLIRRVEKRMAAAGVSSFADYTDYLEVHPDEFGRLFDAILINVTEFFRDREAWDYVRTAILPAMTAGDSPLRIWSAGLRLRRRAVFHGDAARSKRSAASNTRIASRFTPLTSTTLALNEARAGSYSAKQIEQVPADAPRTVLHR